MRKFHELTQQQQVIINDKIELVRKKAKTEIQKKINDFNLISLRGTEINVSEIIWEIIKSTIFTIADNELDFSGSEGNYDLYQEWGLYVISHARNCISPSDFKGW